MRLKLGLFLPKMKSYFEVPENRMLRDRLGPEKWKKTGGCRKVLMRIFVIRGFQSKYEGEIIRQAERGSL
jgi:hypothetical protein